MQRSTRLGIGAPLAAGLVVVVALTRVSGQGSPLKDAGGTPRPAATAAATATPTPGPTPTPTIPPAGVLLARGAGSSETKGSVVEYGVFHSSNNTVSGGFRFWASFSWRHETFRDRHIFAVPAYVNQYLGYATDVRRMARGQWLAVRVHGYWSCRRQTVRLNSALWQSPTFPLKSTRTVGVTMVRGLKAWDIRGYFVRAMAGETTHLQVDVYIGQATSLFLLARESGTVRITQQPTAHISGVIQYGRYGTQVAANVPAVCRHR